MALSLTFLCKSAEDHPVLGATRLPVSDCSIALTPLFPLWTTAPMIIWLHCATGVFVRSGR